MHCCPLSAQVFGAGHAEERAPEDRQPVRGAAAACFRAPVAAGASACPTSDEMPTTAHHVNHHQPSELRQPAPLRTLTCTLLSPVSCTLAPLLCFFQPEMADGVSICCYCLILSSSCYNTGYNTGWVSVSLCLCLLVPCQAWQSPIEPRMSTCENLPRRMRNLVAKQSQASPQNLAETKDVHSAIEGTPNNSTADHCRSFKLCCTKSSHARACPQAHDRQQCDTHSGMLKGCVSGKGASSEAAPAEVRSQLGLVIRELKSDLWRVAAALAPLLSMPAAAPLGQELSRRASRLPRPGRCFDTHSYSAPIARVLPSAWALSMQHLCDSHWRY